MSWPTGSRSRLGPSPRTLTSGVRAGVGVIGWLAGNALTSVLQKGEEQEPSATLAFNGKPHRRGPHHTTADHRYPDPFTGADSSSQVLQTAASLSSSSTWSSKLLPRNRPFCSDDPAGSWTPHFVDHSGDIHHSAERRLPPPSVRHATGTPTIGVHLDVCDD